MDRRNFMKRMAGTGVLVATSQLPVFAEDDPKVFPKRGKYERLAICYATINIGLEKPFSILHISDTHLSDAYSDESEKKQELKLTRTETFGGRQEEALHDTLSWAKDNVDYVLHTGDLIDWQSNANFDLVRKYFGDNMVGTMGNHEFTPDMWLNDVPEERTEAFKDRTRNLLQEVYPFDVRFNSQVINGVNFVMIDDVYAYVTKEQVELFKKEVEKGLPIVLCMHVPFFTDNLWQTSCRYWSQSGKHFTDASIPKATGDYAMQKEDPITRDFIAYLKTEPLLKAILAGHSHITVDDQFSPTAREYLIGANFMFQGREVLFI